MRPIYNNLLLEQFFFLSLNFSLSFFYFPSLSFVPYFFFFMCSLFFLFLSLIFEKVFSFSHFVSKNQETLVKIYLEDVYDIYFFIINDLCISLLHTQYTFLYIFLLHCSNFIKMCARRCVQIMTYFFC
jgi:hypothetical protein